MGHGFRWQMEGLVLSSGVSESLCKFSPFDLTGCSAIDGSLVLCNELLYIALHTGPLLLILFLSEVAANAFAQWFCPLEPSITLSPFVKLRSYATFFSVHHLKRPGRSLSYYFCKHLHGKQAKVVKATTHSPVKQSCARCFVGPSQSSSIFVLTWLPSYNYP